MNRLLNTVLTAAIGLGLALLFPPLLTARSPQADLFDEPPREPLPRAPAIPPKKSRGQTAPKPDTNAPPAPGLVAALLGGTAAWIFSGVDWSDDDAEPDADLLPPPPLKAPDPNAQIPGRLISFEWGDVQGAVAYLLELEGCSPAGSCIRLRLERLGGRSFSFEWPAEWPQGRWRIRSINADGLAGPWSDYRVFFVVADDA